jgi:hypothetical protein
MNEYHVCIASLSGLDGCASALCEEVNGYPWVFSFKGLFYGARGIAIYSCVFEPCVM